MSDNFDEAPIRARYETRKRTTIWPFAVGAVLVAGVGAYFLTEQAFQPPFLEKTTAEAVAESAAGIAIRVLPLIAVVAAALYFGLLRRAAPRQAPAWAAAVVAAALVGLAGVVAQAHMEKEAYIAEGRPAMADLLQRTADRYEHEVLLSHEALNNRMRTVLGPGFLLWSSYQSDGQRDYDRLHRLIADARSGINNHRQHILSQQTETIDRIRVSRLIGRFGKAEAIADLQARFAETAELRERHFTLFSEIMDEVEAQVGLLEQADGRWTANYYFGVSFRDASTREAFNAHSDRIRELAREVEDVTDDLTAEGQRVYADAYDRAVAEHEAERRAEAGEQ